MGSFIQDSITLKHKKTMKLVAASAALLASAYSAQSIDTLIGELIDQVYQHDPIANTHTVNISPYWNAVYTMKADGFTGEGTYGNGDGKINFSEELSFTDTSCYSCSLDFELSQNGPVKASPFVSLAPYIGIPVEASTLDDTFEDKTTFSVNTEGISYSVSGNINGDQFSHSASLNLDNFSMSRTKISATVVFSHQADHSSSIDQAYTNYMIPAGSSSVKLVANVKKVCAENPLDQSCTAKVVVTGDFNSADIGKSVAKWSVQPKKANFQITHNSQEIFWMGLLGIDKFEVLSLKYRLNGGSAVLVVQVVGPAGFQSVAEAASAFFNPYGSFFGAIDSGDDAAHIAA